MGTHAPLSDSAASSEEEEVHVYAIGARGRRLRREMGRRREEGRREGDGREAGDASGRLGAHAGEVGRREGWRREGGARKKEGKGEAEGWRREGGLGDAGGGG